MNKGLEAFDKVLDIICCQKYDNNLQNYVDCVETELERLEKQDEILRIIKEKKVRFDILLEVPNAKVYNSWLNKISTDLDLTEQEFDLLKEYFK